VSTAWTHGRGTLAIVAGAISLTTALLISTPDAVGYTHALKPAGQTHAFKPVRAATHKLVFRPHGLAPQSVRRARVRVGFGHRGHTRSIARWRVRTAIRTDAPLGVRKPTHAHRGVLRVAAKPAQGRGTPPPHGKVSLSVSVAGSGAGSITGPGINCPGDCSETYANGTNVTLSAGARDGSSFGGWSGDCSGGGATCQVAMTSNRSVGANFVAAPTPQTATLKVSTAGSGSGSITGPGINCPGDCSEAYSTGTSVKLNASAASGSSFGGWSGDCSGGEATCQMTVNGDTSASAAFDPSESVTPFYSGSSPFNTPVPADPTVAPNSSQIVQRLVGLGPPAANYAGAAGTSMDWSHPVYFAKASDPVYTIHQTGWANPDVEGREVHIPVGAKPAGGDDASFSVVNTDGWEYDFWQAQAPSGNGGTFTANFAKRAPWDGTGLGTSSPPYQGGITAAGFSNQAGVIRLSEMKAGVINHALFMSVHGWNGRVWPSAKLSGTTGQVADPDAPAMGQHFWLDMTQPQIDALSIPEWQKIILRAMAKYGMYVGDNGGSPWALQFESGDNYTSFGQPDPWIAYAQAQGIAPSYNSSIGRNVYYFNFKNAVDWGSKLKVLEPGQ
jgi:List-Bact-rpt repeat protein